jgi:hypothetical protein
MLVYTIQSLRDMTICSQPNSQCGFVKVVVESISPTSVSTDMSQATQQRVRGLRGVEGGTVWTYSTRRVADGRRAFRSHTSRLNG